MSTATVDNPAEPWPDSIFRLSVEQYHAMIRAGVLTPDDPVELIEGILVYKMPKNPAHRIALSNAEEAVKSRLPAGYSLQLQEPITLGDGEPEPNGTVYRGRAGDYRDRHPGPNDISLVIEVADTTLARDRGVKLRSYARAGLPQYWVVALPERAVDVYRDPDPTAAGYRQHQSFDAGSQVPFEISGRVLGSIPVVELLD
jgi:Uma2 family endonuclease